MVLSIACAAFLGSAVYSVWKQSAGKWAWILPSLWFLFRLVSMSSTSSVLIPGHSIWFQFSGAGCENGAGAIECKNFLMFTIPLIRGFMYSLGAWVSALLISRTSKPDVTDAAVPPQNSASA